MKIICIPFSQGSLGKNEGCEWAPKAIVEQSKIEKGISIPIHKSDIVANEELIFTCAKEAFEKGIPLFIGGDHSITYSTYKAFAEKFGKEKSGLIIFDAHVDCSVMFRPVSHEDLNVALIEEKHLFPHNLLIVGTRKIYDEEKPFLEKKRIQTVDCSAVMNDLQSVKKAIETFCKKLEHLYVSVDIDVLDPSLAPGTGYTVENGMGKKELFELLETPFNMKKVQGVDVVEVNPEKDVEEKTVNIASEIVINMLEKLDRNEPL
jgi:formiminoglutamase